MTEQQIKNLIRVKTEEIDNLKQDLLKAKIAQSPHKIGDVFITKGGYLNILKDIVLDPQDNLVYQLSVIEEFKGILQAHYTFPHNSTELNEMHKIGTAETYKDNEIKSLIINYEKLYK